MRRLSFVFISIFFILNLISCSSTNEDVRVKVTKTEEEILSLDDLLKKNDKVEIKVDGVQNGNESRKMTIAEGIVYYVTLPLLATITLIK